jgi:hypothetical protein
MAKTVIVAPRTPVQVQKRGGSIATTHSQSWSWKGVVSSTFRHLYPWERPSKHCTEGWMSHEERLDGHGKSRFHWDSIPGSSSPYRVTIPTTLSGPPTWWRSFLVESVIHRLKECFHFIATYCPHGFNKNLEAAEFSSDFATNSLRFILITWDYINTGIPSGPFFLAITE